jgi:4-amino-4-deoxy-L-arabinose transferase-like glycosyltransferase
MLPTTTKTVFARGCPSFASLVGAALLLTTGWITAATLTEPFLSETTSVQSRLFLAISITGHASAWLIVLLWISPALERLNRVHFLLLLVLVSAAVRIVWVVLVPNALVSDFAIYHELAQALVRGEGYVITGPVGIEDLQRYLNPNAVVPYTTAYRAPGTALWGAFLYAVFGIHPIAFKLANVLLGTATSLVIFLLLENEKSPEWSRQASLLWALCPSAVMATNLQGTEVLFTFLLVLTAFLLMKTDGNERVSWLTAAAGATCGLAALTRSMLSILLAAALLSFLYRDGFEKGGRRFALFLLFTLLVLSPWALRNWIVFNEIIPICTSEGDFLARHSMQLVPQSIQDSPDWGPRYRAWKEQKNEVEKSKEGYRMARENFRDAFRGGGGHLLRSLHTGVQTAFATDLNILDWSTRTPGPWPAIPERTLGFLSIVTSGWYFMLVVGAFAESCSCSTTRLLEHRGLLFMTLYFLGNVAAFMILVGQDRYHFPVLPFMIILATPALDAFQRRLRGGAGAWSRRGLSGTGISSRTTSQISN